MTILVNLPVVRTKCVTRLWREERAPQMRQPTGKKARGAAQSGAEDRWTTEAGRKEGKRGSFHWDCDSHTIAQDHRL